MFTERGPSFIIVMDIKLLKHQFLVFGYVKIIYFRSYAKYCALEKIIFKFYDES